MSTLRAFWERHPDAERLDVDWAEVGTAIGGHITLTQLTQVDLTDSALEIANNGHAGEIARAMLQRPFRGYFDGNRLS